jgi:hypothetical protein
MNIWFYDGWFLTGCDCLDWKKYILTFVTFEEISFSINCLYVTKKTAIGEEKTCAHSKIRTENKYASQQTGIYTTQCKKMPLKRFFFTYLVRNF